jgi:nucleotide-binding universal stress UspA family protein
MTYHKILVAIDRSPLADLVLDQAVDLAQKESAQMMVFHTVEIEATANVPPVVGTGMGLVPSTGRTIPEVQRQRIDAQNEQAQEYLRTCADKAAARGIATEYDRKVGDPGSLICQEAVSWGADLIVVGRRGRKGMREMLLGSVSNHVIHNAPCSVLVVQGLVPTEEPTTPPH